MCTCFSPVFRAFFCLPRPLVPASIREISDPFLEVSFAFPVFSFPVSNRPRFQSVVPSFCLWLGSILDGPRAFPAGIRTASSSPESPAPPPQDLGRFELSWPSPFKWHAMPYVRCFAMPVAPPLASLSFLPQPLPRELRPPAVPFFLLPTFWHPAHFLPLLAAPCW